MSQEEILNGRSYKKGGPEQMAWRIWLSTWMARTHRRAWLPVATGLQTRCLLSRPWKRTTLHLSIQTPAPIRVGTS